MSLPPSSLRNNQFCPGQAGAENYFHAETTSQPALPMFSRSLIRAAAGVGASAATLTATRCEAPQTTKAGMAGDTCDPNIVQERRTKESYERRIRRKGVEYELAGEPGLRCMMNWCWIPQARAYAMGIYVPDGFKGGPSVLMTDGSSPKLLRMVVAREAAGHHIAHGFGRQLKKRLDKFSVAEAREADGVALEAVLSAFSSQAKLRRGTEVFFEMDSEGNISVVLNGVHAAKVLSPGLQRALMDAYLGEEAVIPSTKKAVAEFLATRSNKRLS